jgi:hypothetical protein
MVIHNDVVVGGSSNFTVQADDQSFIALSVDGEIIGTAQGTGSPVDINIMPQIPGTMVDIVVTKTNFFRYENSLPAISPNSPYVIYEDHLLNDGDGNGNGLMDYAESGMLNMTLQNIGSVEAENVSVVLATSNPYILITDSTESAGNIPGNQSVPMSDAFTFTVADSIPDGQLVHFIVKSEDGDSGRNSKFYIAAHAPVLEFVGFTIDDSEGNNNGQIDAGETAYIMVQVQNSGSAGAYNVMTGLSCPDSYITIHSAMQDSGDLDNGESAELTFSVSADAITPGGFNAVFTVDIQADHNRHGQGSIVAVIGQYSALVLDLDPTGNSAPLIMESFNDMDLIAEYATAMPSDLKNYKSVFICLGIYYSCHELTEAEAQVFKNYLEDGGKIYMEGRLTWHLDQQTSLHPMFNITTESTNWFEYESVYGKPGTFTDGMHFGYEMTQPYNNHFLNAEWPAYEVFSLFPDSVGLMIAYDAGDYKTIGSNFEFGGLVDSGNPSTKNELMSRILGFFGDILTEVENDAISVSNIDIQVYPNPFSGEVSFSFHLDHSSHVILEIYDLTGRLVNKIYEGTMEAGDHRFTWSSPLQENINSGGLYFYRFKAGNEFHGGKLIMTE